jgi:hypothetical protein
MKASRPKIRMLCRGALTRIIGGDGLRQPAAPKWLSGCGECAVMQVGSFCVPWLTRTPNSGTPAVLVLNNMFDRVVDINLAGLVHVC